MMCARKVGNSKLSEAAKRQFVRLEIPTFSGRYSMDLVTERVSPARSAQ